MNYCETSKRRLNTISNSIRQTASFNPSLAARTLLRRNDIIATYNNKNKTLLVHECTEVNVTKIYHNYEVDGRCFTLLPARVNNLLLCIKSGQEELVQEGFEIPCNRTGSKVDLQKLTTEK